MNRLFLAALLSVCVAGGLTSSSLMAKESSATTKPATSHSQKWACPMGCAGSESNEPGKCPKCGMKLKKEKAAKDSADTEKKHGQADAKQH